MNPALVTGEPGRDRAPDPSPDRAVTTPMPTRRPQGDLTPAAPTSTAACAASRVTSKIRSTASRSDSPSIRCNAIQRQAATPYNVKEPMTLFELQAWLGHRWLGGAVMVRSTAPLTI